MRLSGPIKILKIVLFQAIKKLKKMQFQCIKKLKGNLLIIFWKKNLPQKQLKSKKKKKNSTKLIRQPERSQSPVKSRISFIGFDPGIQKMKNPNHKKESEENFDQRRVTITSLRTERKERNQSSNFTSFLLLMDIRLLYS